MAPRQSKTNDTATRKQTKSSIANFAVPNTPINQKNWNKLRPFLNMAVPTSPPKMATDKLSKNPSLCIFLSFEYESFIAKFKNLNTLPKTLLTLSIFNKYSACQCLIHEKGAAETLSLHHYNDTKNELNTFIPAHEFNSIFDIIKRSKNKLFDQSQLLSKHLDIVGVFLAINLDITSHQVIIILSRNDFLPPTPEEYTTFSEIITSFKLPIASIIKNKQDENKLHTLNMAMNALSKTETNSAVQKTKNYHVKKIELLGELLNTLKHELSNPIFGIKLTTDLLAEQSDNIKDSDLIGLISSQASRCQSIIDNFSKLYAFNKDFNICSLKSIIFETLTITKSACRDIKKDVSFNNIDNDDELLINTNSVWLIQILFNIIINASHALCNKQKNKKISISTLKEKNSITVSIIDNGEGIPTHMVEKIFEPFFTTKEDGTGLGLTICNYLSMELGGSITAYNNEKETGTVFKLTLPLN